MARIVSAELRMVDLTPLARRTDAIQEFESQQTPILTIVDADGASGTGYSYTIGTGGRSIVALLEEHLLPQLIGEEAERVEQIWRSLFFRIHSLAVGPIAALALATIDTALWDLRARRAGLPLHLIAGGAHVDRPMYSTEGGWLHISISELVDEAQEAKARGFGGAKLKIGKPIIADDVERLGKVREAVGDDFELMVDANQCFALDEGLRRAHAMRDLGLAWLEEPLPADDVLGHRALARTTSIPVAVGESLYSATQFKDYLVAGACSIVQVDAGRIGGITPWLKVAHLAETFNVRVSPHFLMELHVSLACAVPNGGWVEYIPQLTAITQTQPQIEAGRITPSVEPGLGIDWDWDEIQARQSFSSVVITSPATRVPTAR